MNAPSPFDRHCNDAELLAYFAAHAPHEIPKWFRPRMDSGRPLLPSGEHLAPEAYALAYNYETLEGVSPGDCVRARRRDGVEVSSIITQEHLVAAKAHADLLDATIRAIEAWDAESGRRRVFQWPWYWAAGVLACNTTGQLTNQPAPADVGAAPSCTPSSGLESSPPGISTAKTGGEPHRSEPLASAARIYERARGAGQVIFLEQQPRPPSIDVTA